MLYFSLKCESLLVRLQALRTMFVKTQHGVVQHIVPADAAQVLRVKQLPVEAAAAFETTGGRSTLSEGANATFCRHACKCAFGICTPTQLQLVSHLTQVPRVCSRTADGMLDCVGSTLHQQLGAFMTRPYDLLSQPLLRMEVPMHHNDIHVALCYKSD